LIAGTFIAGVPVLRAKAFCPLAPATVEIDLQLGLHSGLTVLTDRALSIVAPALFAPDDIAAVSDLFGRLPGRRAKVLLTFEHDDGRLHIEQVEAFIVPGPPDESRLGMDVLSRWTVVLDGPGELLLIEPA
jgi:hypothetical protein